MKRMLAQFLSLLAILAIILVSSHAFAAKNRPGSLDGANVIAVENQMLKGSNQLAVSYGLYPMDPYYTGYDVSGAYSYFFSDYVGWEVIRYHYIFTTEKDLTRQLAEKYGVNPQAIDRLKNIFSSSILLPLVYGKQTFANDYYFYHRYVFLLGAGQMNTVEQSAFCGIAGLRGDFAVDEYFSWTMEGRYHIAFNKKQDNEMQFSIGTAWNF